MDNELVWVVEVYMKALPRTKKNRLFLVFDDRTDALLTWAKYVGHEYRPAYSACTLGYFMERYFK